eukprot:40116-Chlamydomonas_euryale.AAC.1
MQHHGDVPTPTRPVHSSTPLATKPSHLRAVHLERRHVEVVDKDHAALADRWSVHSLSALVELGVDDVLDLVRTCLRAERRLDACVHALVQSVKASLGVRRDGKRGWLG